MKARSVALVFVVVLFCVGTSLRAESKSSDERAYIGVRIDRSPLPELLTKHLGLSPNQGVRITNVQRGGPADKARLERDDIIISFEGDDIVGYEDLIDAVQEAGVGTQVSLEVIHLGKHKTVELKLAPLDKDADWKYPPEPELMQTWRPGRVFRFKPGDKDWIEIPLGDVEIDINKLFKELYTFHHTDDGESYTITIAGNPDDEDTQITVRIGDTEYKTTVKDLDMLPDRFRKAAEESLEEARQSSKGKKRVTKFRMPSEPDVKTWQRFFGEKHVPNYYYPGPWVRPSDEILERIEQQMRRLQKRLDRLEERHKEMLDRLPDRPNKQESSEQKNSTQSKGNNKQRI